jgi:hypothetical protein
MSRLDDEIEDVIEEITHVRSVNNLNWMEILRLAIRADPEGAKLILGTIIDKDIEIDRLAAGLVEKLGKKIHENCKP